MKGKIRYITNTEDGEEVSILPITRAEAVYVDADTPLSKWIIDNPGGNGSTVGPTGPMGPRGLQGPRGDMGETGERGPIGPRGDIGNQGIPGMRGEIGPIGPQGVMGPTGPKGDRGIDGNIGTKGATGETGPIGPTGATGLNGPKGDTGVPGPQGVAGPIGETGEMGPRGLQGPQGQTGPTGPTGEIGPKGDNGKDGLQANDMINNSIIGRNLFINTTAAFSTNGWESYNSTISRDVYINNVIDYSGFKIQATGSSAEGLMGIKTSVMLEQYMEYSMQFKVVSIHDFTNIKVGYFFKGDFQELFRVDSSNAIAYGDNEVMYEGHFEFHLDSGKYDLYICRDRTVGDIQGETIGYIRQLQLQKGKLATRWIDSEYTLLEIVNAMKAVDGTPEMLDTIAKMTYEIDHLKEQITELKKVVDGLVNPI